jgi:cell division protein FtsI/penicillin-binding protein 2
VFFPTRQELLAPTKTFGSAILPTLRDLAQHEAIDYGGTTVSIMDAKGNDVRQLYTHPAGSPPNITTTLSGKVQQAAEAALATVPQQAMAVIVQPSTGHILAVAVNQAAATAGDNPLTGLYPPGSTFKIVTASAALQAGTVQTTTPQPCPGTTTIAGRVIPNENQFNLGTVPLIRAFAASCNTTFSQLAVGLSPTALPDSARQMGIGVNYNIPHFTVNTGDILSDTDTLTRAEDGFGQGHDQVTPLGMALAPATVVHGSTPAPVLIPGQTTTANPRPVPLPTQTQTDLQSMMRAVVTDGNGTAKALATITPPVSGKTGTAQFGDGTNSHGWFAGFQGDLSFAFLLVGAGSSEPAVVVAGNFLNGLAR